MKYKLCISTLAFLLSPIYLQATESNIDVHTSINSKIVNGFPAFENYPFMVYLETIHNNKSSFCGGVLISPMHVLTAAHCVVFSKTENDLLPTSAATIYYGSNSIKAMKQDLQKKRVVSRISTHLQFDNIRGYPNDIAILKLRDPINISVYANLLKTGSKAKSDFEYELSQSVNLERGNGNNIASPNLIALGWGDTHHGYPDDLKKAYLITQRSDQCKRVHNSNVSTDSYFCADASQTLYPSDTCFGDSGSPLLWRDENANFYVVGLVSYGAYECDASASVYTKIDYYADNFISKYSGVDNNTPIYKTENYHIPQESTINGKQTTEDKSIIVYGGAWASTYGSLHFTLNGNRKFERKDHWWLGNTGFFIPAGAKDITFYVYQGSELIYKKIFLDDDLDNKTNFYFSTYGTAFSAGVTENS